MGIPLREGRFFREDESDAVAVVSESAARALWPGPDPVGDRVSRGNVPRKWLRVIGVVGDVLSARCCWARSGFMAWYPTASSNGGRRLACGLPWQPMIGRSLNSSFGTGWLRC